MINFSLPIVDVIVPNFNKGKFLKKCLESVVNQTYKKWRLIIVDDNSTDNSLHILKKFKNKKKLRLLNYQKIKDLLFAETWE